MARHVIGIDFGTSESAVALLAMGSHNQPNLKHFQGCPSVPTALLLDPDNGDVLLWGWDALKTGRKRRGNLKTGFKRELGSDDESTRLCTIFMTKLVEVIKTQQSVESLTDRDFATMVGVPANWTEKQRLLTKTIAEDAGLPDVQLEVEPIAAMHALRVQEQDRLRFGDRAENFMVVDFGGGTLDVCIVQTEELGRNPRILATDGDPKLGGVDFDKLIEGWILKQIEMDKDELAPYELIELRNRVVEIKHAMSESFRKSEYCKCNLELSFKEGTFEASKTDFENRCRTQGIFSKFEVVIDRIINKSSLKPKDIRKVIMTGGSSSWYFVGQFIAKKLNLGDVGEIIYTLSPGTDVAFGLAVKRGRGDEPESADGKWVSFTIDEKPCGEKCLVMPGRVQRGDTVVDLGKIQGSKYLKAYRIGFEFYVGQTRPSAKSVGRAEVILHLRSNRKGFQTAVNVFESIKGKPTSGLSDEYKLTLSTDRNKNRYTITSESSHTKRVKKLEFSIGDRARFGRCGFSNEATRTDCKPEKVTKEKVTKKTSAEKIPAKRKQKQDVSYHSTTGEK